MDLVVKLIDKLTLRQPYTGCMRRNQWDLRKRKYSLVKGNAVLLCLGAQRVILSTPSGPSEHMVYIDRAILFRAGPWRPYWIEDAKLEVELLRAYNKDIDSTALIAHENMGELVIKEIDCGNGSADMLKMSKDYKEERRIPKNTERALRICRNCPVKPQCDAADRERAETNDWHPNYPFP